MEGSVITFEQSLGRELESLLQQGGRNASLGQTEQLISGVECCSV
jgi:hypothetical protein